MIRALIIGRQAREWAARLRATGASRLELDTARLPAEGVRQLEATPPDAVIVLDGTGGPQARTLITALRERPIGPLLTILLVGPAPVGVPPDEIPQRLQIQAWLPETAPPQDVVRSLARALDISFDELTSHTDSPAAAPAPQPAAPPTHSPAHSPADPQPHDEPQARRAPRHEPPPTDRPVERVAHAQIFPDRAPAHAPPTRVDADAIRRKLREVRHEDYFTILELRRGAEGPVVREAYRRLSSTFHPNALDFELARTFQDELDEILDALQDAWAVLGDASLRVAYLQAASPPSP